MNIEDNKRFALICKFLQENPDLLSWRAKDKPDPQQKNGIEKLREKFFSAKNTPVTISRPSTVPDETVSTVMQVVYGYSTEQTNTIKKEHQYSMLAENIVGALLERYIASILEPYGWVWCAGDFIRGVDFIKYDNKNEEWTVVQIKNRNNTENSSSSAIRNGTKILKWFRTFSKTGKTNWDNFPDNQLNKLLNEKGFQDFVRNYLLTSK